MTKVRLTPWIVGESYAMRCVDGSDYGIVANRVAFIGKTPRVRLMPYLGNDIDDASAWIQGPKGGGPDDLRSQSWCDIQLRSLGYELPEDDDPRVSAAQTKVILMGVFLSAAAVVGLATGGVHLSPFEWLMLGLAALRCGRMIAFELIAEPLRRPFAVVQPHQYAGDTTEPRYEKGWKHSIGEAMTCPMCAGTWSAAVMLYAWLLVPGPAQVLVTIFSAVSVLEIGHSLIELLCWAAAYYRKESR